MVVMPVLGLGGGGKWCPANPAAGESSPLPSVAPVAAAAPPMKARRESPCRAWCDDTNESNGAGDPVLSMRNSCMVPPKADPNTACDCNTASFTRTEAAKCSSVLLGVDDPSLSSHQPRK